MNPVCFIYAEVKREYQRACSQDIRVHPRPRASRFARPLGGSAVNRYKKYYSLYVTLY